MTRLAQGVFFLSFIEILNGWFGKAGDLQSFGS